jgi:hypothetical protein
LLEEFSVDDSYPLGETSSKSAAQNGKMPQKSMEVISFLYDRLRTIKHL